MEENGNKNEYLEPSLGDGILTRNLGLDIIVIVTMVRDEFKIIVDYY